jgi:hypothetical protein
VQDAMRFEKKISNLIKTNQWLWCWEQTWIDIIDTLYVISINQNIFYERIIITWETCHWKDKSTIYDFPNIWGTITCC